MRRSSREWIGGFVLLVVCVLAFVGLRALLLRRDKGGEVADTARLQEISDFEQARRTDSLRQRAHWDSVHAEWDAEKTAREAARAERQAAYADSQRVWAERREQWAAEKAERDEARAERQAYYGSLRATYPVKLKHGEMLDANSADADALRRVPGIGEKLAAKVMAYRENLGGFVDARQLEEIEGLPYGVSAYFRVAPPKGGVRQTNLNSADFKTINSHPYMSYEQTKAIVNLRRSGRIRGWDDLRGCGLFTDQDFDRLRPYFRF